jgi:hypothetical protein
VPRAVSVLAFRRNQSAYGLSSVFKFSCSPVGRGLSSTSSIRSSCCYPRLRITALYFSLSPVMRAASNYASTIINHLLILSGRRGGRRITWLVVTAPPEVSVVRASPRSRNILFDSWNEDDLKNLHLYHLFTINYVGVTNLWRWTLLACASTVFIVPILDEK